MPDPDLFGPLAEDFPAPMSVFDADLRVVYLNRAARERVRRRTGVADAVGLHLRELAYPGELLEETAARYRAVLAGGGPVSWEVEAPWPTGREWFQITLSPVRGPGGEVTAVASVALDVTARRLSEMAHEAAEARYRRFLEVAPAVAWAKSAEGRFVLANPAWTDLIGVTPAEAVGRTDHDIFDTVTANAFRANDARVLEAGGPMTFEEVSVDTQGVEKHWLAVKFPLDTPTGPGCGGIALDVTELHRLRRDQTEAERRLVETQRLESLGLLAGGVAHDFNNLLTAVLGHASLAREAGGLPTAVEAALGSIETATVRAADLCRQMLAYAGRGRTAETLLDLNAAVSEMVLLLRASVGKGAELRLDLDPVAPVVRADPTQVRQVVMNLITNAADALGEGGGRVTLTTRRESGGAVLEVADTGCGMPAEVRDRVFEPFFTTKFAGRGLGLAAVRGIARSHGGTVELESESGRGTTFRVRLPLADGAPAPPPAPPPAPVTGGGRRVLVVDDEPGVRDLARLILTRAGFTVEAAADGHAGAAAFAARPGGFALVLLDLSMPGQDGESTLRAIRDADPAARVVLMSGYPRDPAAAGGAGFLLKPFAVADLLAAVSAALDRQAGAAAPGKVPNWS